MSEGSPHDVPLRGILVFQFMPGERFNMHLTVFKAFVICILRWLLEQLCKVDKVDQLYCKEEEIESK